MSNNQSITLKPGLKKLISSLILSLAFFIGGGIVVFLISKSLIFKLVGIVSIMFGSFSTLILSFTIILRRPTLLLNNEGFQYKTLTSSLRVPWKDVLKVGKTSMETTLSTRSGLQNVLQNYLVIYLKNPEKYGIGTDMEKQTQLSLFNSIMSFFGAKTSVNDNMRGEVYIQPETINQSLAGLLRIFEKYPVKVEP